MIGCSHCQFHAVYTINGAALCFGCARTVIFDFVRCKNISFTHTGLDMKEITAKLIDKEGHEKTLAAVAGH